MQARHPLKAITLGVALALAGGSAVVYAPTADAQFVCANCGTEWTQIMNNVQLVEQYAKQVQQYQAQLQQLANEARNLASLPQSYIQQYQQMYQEYAQQVQELQGLMSDTASLRDNFKQQYPDIANGSQSFAELEAMTKEWEQVSRQNVEDALAGGASVLGTMEASQQGFQSMGQASQSATGALQAMQAGNQINIGLGQELMKLNAQTAMFQQTLLQEKAREIASDQATNKRLRNTYSDGTAFDKSTVPPAPPIGGD